MKNYKKPILVVELIKLEDVILQSSVCTSQEKVDTL